MKWALAIAALLLIAWGSISCVSTITSPVDPEDPCTVILVRDAWHKSLVLPRADGSSVAYGYGEWNWYALNKDAWYDVFDTLLWPTQGTLGRRWLDAAGVERIVGDRPLDSVDRIVVAREKALRLSDELDREFEAAEGEPHFNPVVDFEFVKYARGYWFWHNCNDAAGEWLERLDCRVTRAAIRLGLRLAR